jgi:hypothetical protein
VTFSFLEESAATAVLSSEVPLKRVAVRGMGSFLTRAW